MVRGRNDPQLEGDIIRLTKQGVSISSIAGILNTSPVHISRVRKRNGLAKPVTTVPMSEDELDRARALLDGGASYEETARTIGRTATRLRKRLPGYPTLTPKEASQLGVLAKKLSNIKVYPGGVRPGKIEKGP